MSDQPVHVVKATPTEGGSDDDPELRFTFSNGRYIYLSRSSYAAIRAYQPPKLETPEERAARVLQRARAEWGWIGGFQVSAADTTDMRDWIASEIRAAVVADREGR